MSKKNDEVAKYIQHKNKTNYNQATSAQEKKQELPLDEKPEVNIEKPATLSDRVEVSNCNKVNVRSGPGKEHKVLFIADEKDEFVIDKKYSLNDEWVMISEPALNLEGFIDSKYLKAINLKEIE